MKSFTKRFGNKSLQIR